MKIDRATYDPGLLLDFFDEGLGLLGALCERTWHDRLEIIADGRAATLWNPEGNLHEVELRFAPAEATTARDAAGEIFPGCPLTFKLAEALRSAPLALERFALVDTAPKAPDTTVSEKLWRGQFPDTKRWRMVAPFKADHHFSLVWLVRCEIQAIDQHWSLHRVAFSLSDGVPDEDLAREIPFHQANSDLSQEVCWPKTAPGQWRMWLGQALERELASDLARVRERQENSLRRELERVDDYFETYERELSSRSTRSSSETARTKNADRLAAAKAEHVRRRADQVSRHEIRIQAHLDALLMTAETGWSTTLQVERDRHAETVGAVFVPRSRRWTVTG